MQRDARSAPLRFYLLATHCDMACRAVGLDVLYDFLELAYCVVKEHALSRAQVRLPFCGPMPVCPSEASCALPSQEALASRQW